MSRKNALIIFIIIIVIIIMFCAIISNKKANQIQTDDVKYNANESTYYVTDKTGNVLYESTDRMDVQHYVNDPNYNPMPIVSKEANGEEMVNEIVEN